MTVVIRSNLNRSDPSAKQKIKIEYGALRGGTQNLNVYLRDNRR